MLDSEVHPLHLYSPLTRALTLMHPLHLYSPLTRALTLMHPLHLYSPLTLALTLMHPLHLYRAEVLENHAAQHVLLPPEEATQQQHSPANRQFNS